MKEYSIEDIPELGWVKTSMSELVGKAIAQYLQEANLWRLDINSKND